MTEGDARERCLGLTEEQDAGEKLEAFIHHLREENARQNLVAKSSLESVWERHILDSAQLLSHVSRETSTWMDLGTGAGFPGLIIAILKRGWKVTLVESRSKRIEWLGRMIDELRLDNVDLQGRRVEVLPDSSYDVISARAFAPLAELLNLSARFSTVTTTWILPKGRSAAQEVQDLRGWNHRFHVEQSLTDPEAGIVVGQLLGRKGAKA